MSQPSAELTRAQHGWALAAIIPFLLGIALFGFAMVKQVFVLFTTAWLLLQTFGYVISLKLAKGDPAHYLVKAQVLLHWTVVVLLVAMILRAL